MARRRHMSLLVGVAVVALSACGSTLQPTAAPAANTSLDGLRVGEATGSAQNSSNGLGSDGLSGSGVITGDPGSPTAGATRSTVRPRTPSDAAAASTKPFRLGVIVPDAGALFAVFGATTDVDPLDPFKSMIDYLNKNGGFGGRKIEPQYSKVDVAADQNAESQRVCEEFTTDNKVDLVLPNGINTDVLLSCLRQRGVAAFSGGIWGLDATYQSQQSNFFTASALGVDRYAKAAVEAAMDLGVMKRGDKLGVLYEDCTWARRTYENVLKPLASSRGLAIERATVKCIENLVSDLGPVTNQSTAAALRFRSLNITHVLTLTAAEGFIVGRFTDGAVGQQYFPKYLLSSNAFPFNNSNPDNTVHFNPGAVPNMTGIGLNPALDVGAKKKQVTPEQAAVVAECKKATAAARTPSFETEEDRDNYHEQLNDGCDQLFFLRAMFAANGGRTSIADVGAGYKAALTNTISPVLVGGRRAAVSNRRDGAGFVQPFKYDPSTRRFVYYSTVRPVP